VKPLPLTARESTSRSSLASESPSPELPETKEVEEDEDLDIWFHSEYFSAGGQKKKALQALSKDLEGSSVHQVKEVQQIPSGTTRVDVKLEYYRDHFEISDPLQRTVEDNFMCREPGHGGKVVNVAKLRSKGNIAASRIEKGEDEGELVPMRPQSSSLATRPQSEMSGRLSRPVSQMSPRIMTPDLMLSAMRSRASAHQARAERAVEKAKEQQLERRIQQMQHLLSSQGRQERAKRERPWMTAVAAAIRLVMMHKFIAIFRHAKHTIHGKVSEIDALQDAGLRSVTYKSGKKLWKSASIRVHGGGELASSILRSKQMEAIEHSVSVLRQQERLALKRTLMWQAWRRLLRLMRFIVRVRKPLRKHNAAEIVKEILSVKAHGFQLTRAVKTYIKNVKLVQRAMRQQSRVLRIFRNFILKPKVWEMETIVLSEMGQIPQAVVKERIDQYMEENEVELWKEEVRRMMLTRTLVWRGLIPPCPGNVKPNYFKRRRSSDMGRGGSILHSLSETNSLRSGALSRPSGRTPSLLAGPGLPASPCGYGLQTPHAVRAQAPLGPASPLAAPETPGRKRTAGAQKAIGSHRKRTEKEKEKDKSMEDYLIAFKSLDGFRLDNQAHNKICAGLCSLAIDAWAVNFKSYQSARGASRSHWSAWRKEVQMCLAYDAALLPEPPDVLTFPELLDTPVDSSFLRTEVEVRLRENSDASLKEAEAAKEKEAAEAQRRKSQSQPRNSMMQRQKS